MDDINLPLDDAAFDDGLFEDGSSLKPNASSSLDYGDGYSEPLVFEDATDLPRATEIEDADVIEPELPAFVDGSSFIDAMDAQEEDASWDVPAMEYSDSPVALKHEYAGPSEPMMEAAAMPSGFASVAGNDPAAFFGASAADFLEIGQEPSIGNPNAPGPPFEPPFVQGGSEDVPKDEPLLEQDEPEADSNKKDSKKGVNSRAKDGLMLGIHVTTKQVYGVLIRPTAEGYEPLRQFVRNRTDGTAFSDSDALSPDGIGATNFGEAATPDLSGGDVAISFGGGAEIDFSHEFAGFSDVDGVAMDAVGAEPSTVQTQPIVFELKDILDECEKSGFGRPPLALSIGAPDVEYHDISVPAEKSAKKKPAKKGKKAKAKKGIDSTPEPSTAVAPTAPVKRDKLMALLTEAHPAVAHEDRVAFVPMTARDGQRRYLSVLPQAGEPVAPSLQMLRQQGRHARTVFRTLEGEVPLLIGLSRLIVAETPNENTAVVRVGAEDTIVLLLSDGQLHHYELMQSVTAFDGPDTICSRVLLQQDVQGVGTVHNVVILADELERELVQGFSAFYPESHVETLRDGLARHGLVGPYGPLAPSLVVAAGAALAGAMKNGPFENANLLPAELRKKRRRVEFRIAWHTVAIGMMLFLSVLFFAYLYISQAEQIADAEQRLTEYPVEAQMTVPQLQARIDSLRLRQSEMSATMGALDSLLVGTDAWTQTLLKSTRAASGTGGIWIEDMDSNGGSLQISGYATSRDRVVGMAQRLGGTIDEMTFQDVREYPVYEYRITFPMEGGLPQVTRILREQVDSGPTAPYDPSDAALDAALGDQDTE